MDGRPITVLDGRPRSEQKTDTLLTTLTSVVKESGAEVRVFPLCDMKLVHCIGCFGCWLETPGICRYKEPDHQELIKAWLRSDAVVLFTPVTFGGYSSPLKQAVERILPTLLPYMAVYHGDVHHVPRYKKYPRLIGIGVQDLPDPAGAGVFKLLVGRHAIDNQAPGYSAEVINASDSPERLTGLFRSMLTRNDVLPIGKFIRHLMPPGEAVDIRPAPGRAQRACLIVGSPKTLSASTSSALGNYVLDRMKEHGWETESLTLTARLLNGEGESALISAVDHADQLIFAFPLYIDALPYLMTRALEGIARHRRNSGSGRPLRLFAIANNGFPESYQNNLALSICQNFAASCGITWMGALALGAGESLIGGGRVSGRSGLNFPVPGIPLALRSAAAALANGRPVPAEAVTRLAASPVPYTPFLIWRHLFIRGSKSYWEKRAAGFGVDKKSMLAQPYLANANG